MHRILNQIKEIIESSIKSYLPDIKKSDLENNGAVYYMNGKDGTEFDWYVNDKLPPFMVFYNDKENLGAVKLLLYKDGEAAIYLYGESGKKLIQEVSAKLKIEEAELFELAVILKNEADERSIWGGDIESIHTDMVASDEQIAAFKANEGNYSVIRNRKMILNSYAYVSKKITREGWKVGYMERREPIREGDSGWFFFAGNGDEYTKSAQDIELVPVGAVWQQFDQDIFQYIDMPAGTRLIRVSKNAFEIDKNDKEIYAVKR
ncbi:MAG: DUF2185 domain-containing protein [Bacteroidales bacterium]|nr:DUF2185 domain-containing protein [Lachnoclostridium sp.]MCM1384542.1 DUF2185 domain-containing protein [Lachnoclostridium sp.]MCM1464086.1 DUF2185 domain-containing protein [Bacteroidales bacterium]